mmetsp:Transcript_61446/g.190447  ORF Transcript_61446/g.190447 Transcript_61446/m.190447 type:complete len:204 (+) Transcript_61446:382-993(+)
MDAGHHVLHGVHQPTRLCDHRQGAKAHGLHLRQAAGLPARRHEVEVGGSHQGVALGPAPAGHADFLGELLRQGLGGGHEVRAARAHDDNLQVQVCKDRRQSGEEVVVALLQVHAADEDAKGGLLRDGQTVEVLDVHLQCRLLLVHVLEAERGEHHGLLHEGLVCGVDTLLHAVHNAGDALRIEYVIELNAHLGQVEQLPSVRG